MNEEKKNQYEALLVFRPVKRQYVGEYRKSCITKAEEIDAHYRTNLCLMKIMGLSHPTNSKRAKSSCGVLKPPTLFEECEKQQTRV